MTAPRIGPDTGLADGPAGGDAMDDMTPGRVLSPAQERERLEVLAVQARWHALEAVELGAAEAFVAQLDALLAVYDDTRGGPSRWYGPQGDDQLVAEVAVLTHQSEFSVGRRLNHALAVRAVPLLRRLLLTGRLGVPHAVAAIDEVTDYGDETAARVLEHVLHSGREPGWEDTPSTLVLALRRRVQVIDPDGCAERRAAHEAASTGVRLKALTDGMAKLTATGNALTVRAAHTLLGHLSTPTGPDDPRTAGQRQLEALCQALVAAAGAAVPLELAMEIPVHPTAPNPVAPAGAALDPVVVRHDLTGELLALLTGTPAPPPDPAASARAAQTVAEDAVEAQEAADEEEAATAQTGQPAAATAAPAGDAPATARPPDLPGRRTPRHGVPDLDGIGPVDRGLVRDLLGHEAQHHGLPTGLAGITLRRLCVDPGGQVISADPVAIPLARLLAQAQHDPPGRRTDPGPPTTPAQLLHALTRHLPEPPPDTGSYQPTAAQKRVVRARDPHCTFPGCRRPARTSQLDHRDPHPDGPTSTLNLHPLCKHHHDLKHAGWQPTRHRDGSTTWTSPRGQTATVRPD